MAVRTNVFVVMLAITGCGNDSGGTKNIDAPAATDDSMATGDAAATVDGSMSTADAGMGAACGMTTCSATEECCVDNTGPACVAAGTCQGASFACDGPEDCTSTQVCCYEMGGGGGMPTGGSECRMANQCQLTACHENADCTGTATMCCPVANTPYKVCLAQCPML